MAANATDVVTVAQLKDYDQNRASGGGITIDDVYPVGSIYMSVASTSPETLFGGTWTRIQDVFLMCGGSSYSPGSTGGSADLIVPSHTHTATTASDGAHKHTITVESTGSSHSHSARTSSAGSHNHDLSGTGANSFCGITAKPKDAAIPTGPSAPYYYCVAPADTASAGSHTHSVTVNTGGAHTHSGTAASAGSHTHTVTVSSTGESGTGANIPPYLSVYCWRRDA